MSALRPDPIRVFVVDDHEMVRLGLAEVCRAGGLEVAGEAATAAEALERIVALKPDVVLLDVVLPDGDGIEICRQLVPQDPSIKYLMLTSYSSEKSAVAAIEAGAWGFLLKDVSGPELVASIRAVAAGGAMLAPAVAAGVLDRVRVDLHHTDPRIAELTAREREVLRLVGRGFSNREIAEELYLAEKTVRNYVWGVLQKLGMHQRTMAALLGAELEASGDLTAAS